MKILQVKSCINRQMCARSKWSVTSEVRCGQDRELGGS